MLWHCCQGSPRRLEGWDPSDPPENPQEDGQNIPDLQWPKGQCGGRVPTVAQGAMWGSDTPRKNPGRWTENPTFSSKISTGELQDPHRQVRLEKLY